MMPQINVLLIYYSAIFAFFPERVFSRRMIKIFGAEFQRQMVQLGDNIIKQHTNPLYIKRMMCSEELIAQVTK